MRIRLRDKEFAHAQNFNGYDVSKNIQWDRQSPDGPNEITIFTERTFNEIRTSVSKIKIAWLLECERINNSGYKFIKEGGYKLVDYVLTNHKSIVDSISNAIFFPFGGSWFVEKEWQIYPKNKNISIIASKKKETEGHKLRHTVVEKFKNKIDFICGWGYKPIQDRMIGFKDFRYTIVIENYKTDYYWTEKLTDAFATGTIPIYWGCPSINNFFDSNGIIGFNHFNDLNNIFNYIGEQDYNNRINSIKKNFITAKQYKIMEDYLYLNFLKRFDNV